MYKRQGEDKQVKEYIDENILKENDMINVFSVLDMKADVYKRQVWRREIDGIEHALWIAADTKGGYYVAVFNPVSYTHLKGIWNFEKILSGSFRTKSIV